MSSDWEKLLCYLTWHDMTLLILTEVEVIAGGEAGCLHFTEHGR